MSDATSDVLLAQQGSLGRITLNRPKALNALTHGMILTIDQALQDWESSTDIAAILLEGAGERGLCAGGDIRAVYDDMKVGRYAGPEAFFRDEYRLNARIAEYRKPIVALMDGIVMGGGIGLSAHASHRVVTPRSMLAMPEVGIGFIPDVGGTFLLSRAPGLLGVHAALTAGRLSAADAIQCGLADLYVPAETLPALVGSLGECPDAEAIRTVLERFAQAAPPSALAASQHWIDVAYAKPTIETILAALQASDDAAAQSAAQEIQGKSPTSLKVALRLLQEARHPGGLRACLQREYNAAMTLIRSRDFVEGVRAAVVDKDRSPHWSPATLADVTPDIVDAHFRALPEHVIF